MDYAQDDCENGRPANVKDAMHFVDPDTGKLVPLVLQSLPSNSELDPTTKWLRIRHSAPFASSMSQFSYWIGSPILVAGTHDRQLSRKRILQSLGRFAASLPALCVIVLDFEICATQYKYAPSMSRNAAANQVHFYPVVLSRHVSPLDSAHLPRHNRLPVDGASEDVSHYSSHVELSATSGRQSPVEVPGSTLMANPSDPGATSRPRFLCYVDDFEKQAYSVIHVSSYLAEHGNDTDMEFIFVSYTRQQFRVNTHEEIDAWPHYENEAVRTANRTLALQDRKQLTHWAIDAAQRAGKRAFWIDFECVRDEDGAARSTSSSDDVYRICDVVRASHSMIIAIGPPIDARVNALLAGTELPGPENSTSWLRHWGSRLWTLPELLLCPGEHRVKLYVSGGTNDPLLLAKRNFAERAWDDAELVKELVNHYEGSAQLTQLRLISTALQCFSSRRTESFSPGDVAYAIMGLLPNSQRPRVLQSDSGFQAFVRLSLANDGGDFVQRLLCLTSPRHDGPWYDTEDVWGARLIDVRAESRIAKVLDDDVLAIDGVHGTTIQWDKFDQRIVSGEVAKGCASGILLMCLLFWGTSSRIFYVEYYAIDRFFRGQLPVALNRVLFMSIIPLTVIFAVLAPILYLSSRRQVRNPVKPEFVGIEGHVEMADIETYLWGFNHGRLRQIPNSSATVTVATKLGHYTLVDTYSMTVFYIRAERPPTALFVMGQEADSLRAVLCSYDHDRDVFVKETMVLIGLDGLDRMRRVRRFKMRQHAFGSAPEKPILAIDTRKADCTPWGFELVFAIILVLRTKVSVPFMTDDRHLGSTTAYSVSFGLAQILAWYLIIQVSIPRIFRVAVSCKAFSLMFHFLAHFGFNVWYLGDIYAGMVDSVLMATFIVVILSWSRSQQAAWRLLALGLAPSVVNALFQLVPYGHFVNTGAEIGYLLLSMGLSLFPMKFIGKPTEVSWLSSHKKVEAAQHAVLQFHVGGWNTTAWFKDVRLYAMFALSFCCSFPMNERPKAIDFSPVAVIVAMIVISMGMSLGIRMSHLIIFPNLMCVVILSTLGTVSIHLSVESSLLQVLSQLRVFALPLLWLGCIWCSTITATTLLYGMTGIAHLGWTLAILIKMHMPLMSFWMWNVVAALMAVALMGGWMVKEVRGRRGYFRL